MPKLKVLSGKKLVDLLKRSGFSIARIKGSHVILKTSNEKNVVIVPLYKELDRGTLNSIIKIVRSTLSEDLINKNFYK